MKRWNALQGNNDGERRHCHTYIHSKIVDDLKAAKISFKCSEISCNSLCESVYMLPRRI